jgi:hypothetical protein
MVDHINNGEEGFSVREKLNTVIDRTNTLNGIENQVEANKNLSQQNSARINKEIQDRIDGDQELWDHVNDVEDQLDNLDVSILDAKIDQEILDRIAGDEALDAKIDSVESSLTGAITSGDTALQGQIDAIVAELADGGTGAGMVISPTEPPVEDRVEGMQWLDSTTADVWIWDGEKWLEFPVKGVQGDQGEPGEKGDKGDKGDTGEAADVPPWDYEFTPNTLVLRDNLGNLKGKKVIGQTLQMTTGGTTDIVARPGDTIFYSSTSNQLYKNSKDGMRAALGIQDADNFFTDISAETGNNTIERFGDEVWVTNFKTAEVFVGTKIGNGVETTGNLSAGDGTFGGTVAAAEFTGDGSTLTGVATSGYQDAGDFNDQLTNPFVNSFNATANAPNGVNGWYNTVNIRHRGGQGDGNRYGAQIAVGMTTQSGRLFFRNQNSDAWGEWQELGNGISATDVTALYEGGSAKKVYTYGSGGRVTGNLLATSDVYAYYSDERLKTKTGEIENALDKVEAIDCFYYTHNDIARSLGYEGDDQQVGVSAQSVKAVMPECVGRAPIDDDGMGGSVSGEDYMTVKYERLVPLLLQSISELAARVKELEANAGH